MIPYYDLKSINSKCLVELQTTAQKIITSGHYISETHEFERNFADYVGAEYCVGTSSGTTALYLCLDAIDIRPGDEVITVSQTYKATAEAIKLAGGTPVYVDIDYTFTMDYSKIEEKITPKTKAIIPVHLYGNVCNMNKIMEIAKKHNLYVIEDCAQAHGSKLNGQHVGTFGHMGAFSFYPGKSLGGFGDSGAIVSNDPDIIEKIIYKHTYHRMDVMQAKLLDIKLIYLPDIIKQKQEIAEKYNEVFTNVLTISGVEHSYHIYPILRENREDFISDRIDDIELRYHYALPVHRMKGFEEMVYLPQTEYVSSRQISLPIYPGVDYERVMELCKR